MSLPPSPCSDYLRLVAEPLGVSALGIATAEAVDSEESERYRRWIVGGNNAGMEYLCRYNDVRNDPRLLLDGAKSIVMCAFNYFPPVRRKAELPEFALYAYGRDYHEVLREKLGELAKAIKENFGGETRVCVDTAPILERYWAMKAGIGFKGINSQLIIPGMGSYFFLGEIITTAELEPDKPCTMTCDGCMKCVSACPGHAIAPDGNFDARRCISYFTIEHRGDFPEGVSTGNHSYGCDTCLAVCPHNKDAFPTSITDFHASEEFLSLDADSLRNLDRQRFNELFRHSAVKRVKLEGLLRNLRSR